MKKLKNRFHPALARKRLTHRLMALFHQPVFWFITLWGHGCILAGTVGIHHFEHGINPKLNSWLDTLFWSIATVTTVGYGDAAPVTGPGKVVGIFMMILGSLFLVSYTALFAGALLSPELQAVEQEVNELEKDFELVDRETQLDTQTLELLRKDIQALRQELEELRKSRPG